MPALCVPNEGPANCGRVAAKVANSTLVISGVTGPKFTKFVHDVAESSPCELLEAAYRLANPLLNRTPIIKSEGFQLQK